MNQLEQDEVRTKDLNDIGFSIIEFTNDDVLNKTDKVLVKLKKSLDKKIIDFREDNCKYPPLRKNQVGSMIIIILSRVTSVFSSLKSLPLALILLWGATYMVLAPEHPFVDMITTNEQKDKVEEYRASVKNKSTLNDNRKKKRPVCLQGLMLLILLTIRKFLSGFQIM